MSKPETFHELFYYIKTVYNFDSKNYALLKPGMKQEEILNFAIAHSLKHMVKQIGTMSAMTEAFDHTGEFKNINNLKKPILKEFANVLRLAELIGMTPEDLINGVPDIMKSQPT